MTLFLSSMLVKRMLHDQPQGRHGKDTLPGFRRRYRLSRSQRVDRIAFQEALDAYTRAGRCLLLSLFGLLVVSTSAHYDGGRCYNREYFDGPPSLTVQILSGQGWNRGFVASTT